MKYWLLFSLIFIVLVFNSNGQEYSVVSFEPALKDLTARTEHTSRVDGNGRKCAVIKVYANDGIAAVRGNVVGQISASGMEKWIYLLHDSKDMEIIFENHLPLHISFIDYDVPTLTGQMTYILKLKESNNNQLLQNDNNSIALNETKDQSIVYTAIKLSNPDGEINRRGYVDLGLPSGLKWAICNIGTTLPEASGDCFAWGETSRKSFNPLKSSTIYKKDEQKLKSKGIVDSSGNLTPSYDAAQINWGGSWRMPTKEELQELLDNCQWIWTTINGKSGCIVIGPNKKSIFLPVSGYKDNNNSFIEDGAGHYWTATVNRDRHFAHELYLGEFSKSIRSSFTRSSGMSVRPVSK